MRGMAYCEVHGLGEREMSKIAVIVGSPSDASRLYGLVDAAVRRLIGGGHEVDTLRVTDLPPEDLIYARFDSPAVRNAAERVARADAVVVASQVYKASYTGVLKTFLDLLPQKGLASKAVFPLFVGGTMAHFLSIDYALKPVLSSMGARTVFTGVYALDSQIARAADGAFQLQDDLQARLDASLDEFLAIL
jgi:FMN reductase